MCTDVIRVHVCANGICAHTHTHTHTHRHTHTCLHVCTHVCATHIQHTHTHSLTHTPCYTIICNIVDRGLNKLRNMFYSHCLPGCPHHQRHCHLHCQECEHVCVAYASVHMHQSPTRSGRGQAHGASRRSEAAKCDDADAHEGHTVRYPVPLPTSSARLPGLRCAERDSRHMACMCGALMVTLWPMPCGASSYGLAPGGT